MTNADDVPVSRLTVTIRPDDGSVSMRTVALGIPGAMSAVVELEADENETGPGFHIKVDAGGFFGNDEEMQGQLADLLITAGQALREYTVIDSSH